MSDGVAKEEIVKMNLHISLRRRQAMTNRITSKVIHTLASHSLLRCAYMHSTVRQLCGERSDSVQLDTR